MATEDSKIITKMTCTVTVAETVINKNPAIIVQNKKKCVMVLASSIIMPEMENRQRIMTVDESWLLETISKLCCFRGDSNSNQIAGAFCFDTCEKMEEELDKRRMGIRKISGTAKIEKEVKLLLPGQSVPILKKLMEKEPGNEVTLWENEKYVKVTGTGFTYMVKRIEGEYL